MTKRHPLMPSDTPDYMADAWVGCIHYASGTPEITDKFCRDTGRAIWLPQDQSCADAFIRWANAHIWGPIGGVLA